MKTATILLLAILAITASAKQTNIQATITNLVNMSSRAVDAVDAALDLLQSLKQQNVDAQKSHDELNATQELSFGQQIADQTAIADLNKAAGDAATAHREELQYEIQVTNEYLIWINNRRVEINRKREEFKEQRCYASLMFVKQLKEHDEALEVIRWLREDILGVIADHDSEVDFSQIKSSADKLSAYAHLFTSNQIKEFASLQSGDFEPVYTPAQEVDAEVLEGDDRSVDNEQGALQLERQTAGTEERDLGNRMLDMIDKLEQHIEESMANLKTNEIKAAWDLVRWLQSTEIELVHLDEEQAVKSTYIDKLLIAVVGAKAREDKLWEIYFESSVALNNTIDELNRIRAFYAQEKARREEENALLDEVITIFMERVDTIDKGMRQMASDHNDDGQFNEEASDLSRRTDAILDKDGGSLAANVAAESRA